MSDLTPWRVPHFLSNIQHHSHKFASFSGTIWPLVHNLSAFQEHFGLFLEQLQQHRLSVQHSLHLSVEEEEVEGEEREEVGNILMSYQDS